MSRIRLRPRHYAEILYPLPGMWSDDDTIHFAWHRALAIICFSKAQWDEVHACL